MIRNLVFNFTVLSFFLLSVFNSKAQVSLAPTSVYISDQTNAGSLYVTNRSEVAQEISISWQFGYPGSDEQGNLVTVYDDTLSAERFGIDQYLRAFPRQFVLEPGKQQTVRLMIRPMAGKPDGMYWTRLIVTSNAAAKDAEKVAAQEGTISTQINYVFKQNIPAFYSKGKTGTGLTVGKVTTQSEAGKLIAVSQLTPTGNAPFNGSVTARLLDSAGKEIASHSQTVVAYFEVLRRMEIKLPEGGIPPGKYTLEFTYETRRNDVPPSDLAQSLPVVYRAQVEIK